LLPELMPYSSVTMTSDASVGPRPQFLTVGHSDARAFGMGATQRARALAAQSGLEVVENPDRARGAVVADVGYAWDPGWLGEIARRPRTRLVADGANVLVHVPAGEPLDSIAAAMERGTWDGEGYETLDPDVAELTNHQLRKRERPFVMRLDPNNPEPVERAAYDASYKGVTDALTLYLWRRPAFYLTRWAARAGLSPNMVTLIGAILCVAAFFFFWYGRYWAGCIAGFGFMVLDTVDGKLARCTGQSSKWGNIFDHGIDLVHPPFWWWAWAEGLGRHGPLHRVDYPGLEPVYEALIVGAIVFGYIAQRIIEGIFMRRFGMHIHVWRPIDSKFRLVTARRNPNMVILVGSLVFGRPDMGLQLVALWTVVSLIFHAVRLAQANARHDRGRRIISWLA
jgi:phosphatidylglycerophosphate synthase